MDYKETINWMFNQLPMYQRIGKAAYKADLSNTESILSAIGNPENKFVAIHVAGTNGKGSVSHIIASILQEAGYKTGLYTSPHLKDFRERIKINGELIPEKKVQSFIETYKSVFTDISSSFFEMTVGLAFNYFAKEKVDFAVIETGLGGRLDSTNLCKPIISVITNIGIDHTAFLGDTIEKIASEKAGIIKLRIPVIIGKHQNQTDQIFTTKARETSSPIIFAEDDMELRYLQSDDKLHMAFDMWYNNTSIFTNLKTPLIGNYQKENIRTALRTIIYLKEDILVDMMCDNIINGIANVITNTGLHGRWQQISTNPTIICDTGHNIDGIKSIVSQLIELNYNKLHFVLGMVADKDIMSILTLLPKDATYYYCKPDIPRGLDEMELSKQATKIGLVGKTYSSVIQAYHSAQNNAGVNDLIFIGGSTYVVAEVI